MQIKQKFSQVANEDGFITLNEFEALLQRLPATQDNPELIELYKKVLSIQFIHTPILTLACHLRTQVFDKDGNQTIEFTDVAAALSVMFKGSPKERLKSG